jgi:antitoxin component YwqK of YwqJK toxin-antitoxin module
MLFKYMYVLLLLLLLFYAPIFGQKLKKMQNMCSDSSIIQSVYWVNNLNKEDGEYLKYHCPTGNLEVKGYYSEGEKIGTWLFYLENGFEYESIEYDRGIPTVRYVKKSNKSYCLELYNKNYEIFFCYDTLDRMISRATFVKENYSGNLNTYYHGNGKIKSIGEYQYISTFKEDTLLVNNVSILVTNEIEIKNKKGIWYYFDERGRFRRSVNHKKEKGIPPRE